MGTRGIYGFRKNGIDKITYNHLDSYPKGLGEDIADFCRNNDIAKLNQLCDKIQMVNNRTQPTEEQVEDCKQWTNLKVSEGRVEDWYCLLHKTQGDLTVYQNGLNYMMDYSNFIKDSLFCEHGYIINLDTNELEYWEGFQQEADPTNRYGSEEDCGYFPCRLSMTFPIDRIPENAVELMEAASAELETDDEMEALN